MRTITLIPTIMFCLVILCACGETGKYAVFTGRVTQSDTSLYVADVKVYEQSHAKLNTLTDSLGYFRLDGVSFEEHNIYFEKEGFETFVFNFEYRGKLSQPIVTEHIVLYRPGEEPIKSEKSPDDTL